MAGRRPEPRAPLAQRRDRGDCRRNRRPRARRQGTGTAWIRTRYAPIGALFAEEGRLFGAVFCSLATASAALIPVPPEGGRERGSSAEGAVPLSSHQVARPCVLARETFVRRLTEALHRADLTLTGFLEDEKADRIDSADVLASFRDTRVGLSQPATRRVTQSASCAGKREVRKTSLQSSCRSGAVGHRAARRRAVKAMADRLANVPGAKLTKVNE